MKPLVTVARLLLVVPILFALGCNQTLTPVDPTEVVGTWRQTDLAPAPATGWYVFQHEVRFGADGSFQEWIAQSNATPGAIPPTAFSNDFTGTWELRGDTIVTTTSDGTKVRHVEVEGSGLVLDGNAYEAVSL